MFISIDKMKQLREQAKNGDERARKILNMQMRGEDFSGLLEEHFKPIEEKPATQVDPEDDEPVDEKLKKFLDYNDVHKGDPEYNDMVEAFYQENPQLRPKDNLSNGNPAPMQIDTETITQEQPKPGLLDELSDAVKDLLSVCDRAIINVADDSENDITGATLKGTLSTLQEIKQSALDAFEKIKTLKTSIAKKQESDIM